LNKKKDSKGGGSEEFQILRGRKGGVSIAGRQGNLQKKKDLWWQGAGKRLDGGGLSSRDLVLKIERNRDRKTDGLLIEKGKMGKKKEHAVCFGLPRLARL